ncbi:hypothetical protein PS850_06208 [Pseudomonas fluorescens]|nr:hypothetical protein PS850_06208 [Pseudomonas fluorescens]
MNAITLQKYRLVGLAVSIVLSATSVPALAEIDTFTLDHVDGPCREAPFITNHATWEDRSRVRIATGEKITVTLYGHGADFAQDAIGQNIREWITDRGRTTDYPRAHNIFEALGKGYVKVAIRAAPEHGLGNRKVTVKWPTGHEFIYLKIVPDCNNIASSPYRNVFLGSGIIRVPGGGGTPQPPPPRIPNLMPNRDPLDPLTRPIGNPINTIGGAMFQVNSFFCSGLLANTPSTVDVPGLSWGVIGVNEEAANTRFDVVLIDAVNNRTLDTFTLPQGFPENTPLVRRDNYPGRATSIHVIMSPRYRDNQSANEKTAPGCFTVPGNSQLLDPKLMLIRVDPSNLINEGNRENDNELRF